MAKTFAGKRVQKKAAKKPAQVVNYKAEYEKLKKAAEAVAREVDRGQIEDSCEDGTRALDGLLEALGRPVLYGGGTLTIEFCLSHNTKLDHESKVEITGLQVDGKVVPPDAYTVDVYAPSTRE